MGLQNLWDLQDPKAKICRVEGDVDNLPPDSTIKSTICDNSSSILQFEYTIHKNAQFPKYRILQKDCKEEFDAGTEPVVGSATPDKDGRMTLTRSAPSDGNDTVAASLEILLTENALESSWWERFVSNENQTVEFCIRTGLWLPPQAGDIEVNFREINVAVILEKEPSAKRGGLAVNKVVVNPKELVGLEVNLPGGATDDSNPPKISADKDEL